MSDDELDLLAVAAHPDDAELLVGGTLLLLADRGLRTGVCDLTRGERATLGDADTRAREAARAAEVLGLGCRENLGLEDAALTDDVPSRRALTAVFRRLRPRAVLAPWPGDPHPDHAAAGHLARAACFLAGLDDDTGAPHRPRSLWWYPGLPSPRAELPPVSLAVAIDAVRERKLAAVRCHASQFPADEDDAAGSFRSGGPRPLERLEARDRWYGALVGARFAEPFVALGPLAVGPDALVDGLHGPHG